MGRTDKAAAIRSRRVLLRDWEARSFAAGRKTLIVRPMKPQPPAWIDTMGFTPFTPPGSISGRGLWQGEPAEKFFPCPFGSPGDELVGCEAHRILEDPGAEDGEIKRRLWDEANQETIHLVVDYRSDGGNRIRDKIGKPEWKSASQMPAWAARWRWRNAGVWAKRLGDLSGEDLRAFGVSTADAWEPDRSCSRKQLEGRVKARWAEDFGKQHPVESNPWVFGVRVEPWPK